MISNAYNIQINNNNTQEIFRQYYAEYNDVSIQLNTKRNFHRTEFDALYTKSIYKGFIKCELEDFKDTKNLTKPELRYARLLAFYRRIDIDFYDAISHPISINSFPLDTIDNFIFFNKLFEKYYNSFEEFNKSEKLKTTFKSQCDLYTLKLWMAGYGVIEGFTEKYITTELLSEIFQYTRTRTKVGTILKYIRFISFALSQEEISPITEVFQIKENTSLFDRELGKWDDIIGDNILGKTLKEFCFNYIYPRTKGDILHEYRESNGEVRRDTYAKLSPGAFTNYSGGLRDMFLELKKINADSIDDALNSGILDILSSTKSIYGKTKYSTLKLATKLWVKHYILDNNLDLNINKIIPLSTSRKSSSHGKILNISDVTELIDILLNDQSPFYENISITDYRCRYACLLMLSTGQRVSEISCLAYDCLKKDRNGDLYVVLHKTKRNTGNTVFSTPDVIDYVNKLRIYSPKAEILFSTEIYPYADNLKIRRLIAGKYNNTPLGESTINRFLKRIQQYLWGKDLSNKDRVFTCHDFRRMKATYMNWIGYTNESIQKQLGQSNINSQLPYLQTKPIEHQEAFNNIYKQGVYQTDENGNVVINKNRVFDKASDMSSDSHKESHELLVKSILSNMKNADEINIKNVDTTVLEPTGFPIGIYSCSASKLINCNKSPVHCFSCNSYVPDEDSLDIHKVELFRYIILSQYQSNSIKSTKDIIVKGIVSEKIKRIDECIDEAFEKLFAKFNLDKNETNKIQCELESKAKSYLRKYSKSKPSPNFKEAKKYLEEGKL